MLAYPALDMKTGVSGVNSFPNSFQSKQGFAVLEKQFTSGTVSPVQIVVDGNVTTPAVKAAMTGLTKELANDPAFGPVQLQTDKAGNLALLSVPVNGDPTGSLALNKVRELRGTLIPKAFAGSGASVYVTGQTAGNLDYIDIVNSYFPWVVALVLSLSFVLLLVAFRSVVIPLKAILMNLLSVGAAYGLITLVSLKGWGASLLGFQQVPVVEQWVPLLLFAVLFGLSMDYQVFLLSRIKEAWDRTGDNTLAVTEGIGATAGIITGAALIMVAVFAGFASGQLVMFQQMGFGLAVAVLPRRDADPHHPGAVGHEAARPLELVPAELARVAAAPEHRGRAAGPADGGAGAHESGVGRPGPRARLRPRSAPPEPPGRRPVARPRPERARIDHRGIAPLRPPAPGAIILRSPALPLRARHRPCAHRTARGIARSPLEPSVTLRRRRRTPTSAGSPCPILSTTRRRRGAKCGPADGAAAKRRYVPVAAGLHVGVSASASAVTARVPKSAGQSFRLRRSAPRDEASKRPGRQCIRRDPSASATCAPRVSETSAPTSASAAPVAIA